ncbi:GNAT family N-acetyltransferase [Shouchella sp. 1P09AA]|uniref:GNAT family N-acetyltransferase n=1 Tax=unclassified Shouchella TaxID=2893065 RepID=UPI00399F9B89
MSESIMETDRLALRAMTHHDVEHLLKIFSDPEAMAHYPKTKNEAETMKWINWQLQLYDTQGAGLWIVEDKRTGTFLGQCGLVPQVIEEKDELEIGYLFARDFWGNGYATEAASACRDFAFSRLDRKRVISLIAPLNYPSIRVAKRVGMEQEKRILTWGKEILVFSMWRG